MFKHTYLQVLKILFTLVYKVALTSVSQPKTTNLSENQCSKKYPNVIVFLKVKMS